MLLLVLAAALPGASCGIGGVGGPSRETVLAALQAEAASLKKDGEKVSPSLGVRSTWTIEQVDVQPQAGSENQPWKGSIRLRIENRMKDADGAVTNDKTTKTFNYVYDAPLGKWLIQPIGRK